MENAILQGLVGMCSFVCVNVASETLVMWLVIDTAVVSSRCSEDEVGVEAIPRERLLLRNCSHSGHIPVEGQNSGTCCVSGVHGKDEDVMYRLAESLVPGLVECCQRRQSHSVV